MTAREPQMMHAAASSAAGGYQTLTPGQSWKTPRSCVSAIHATNNPTIAVAFHGNARSASRAGAMRSRIAVGGAAFMMWVVLIVSADRDVRRGGPQVGTIDEPPPSIRVRGRPRPLAAPARRAGALSPNRGDSRGGGRRRD